MAEKVSVRLEDEDIAFCRALGGRGGLTAGIKLCIRAARNTDIAFSKLNKKVNRLGQMMIEIHRHTVPSSDSKLVRLTLADHPNSSARSSARR